MTEAVILPGMKLKPGVINKEGALLTPRQVQILLAAVSGIHPSHPVAACHIPHNAFVFYDAERKPVAFIEICFGCLGNRTMPARSSPYVDILALAALFNEHRLPMGEYPDLAAFKKHFTSVSRRAQ